jgi:hypothetical protein
MTIASGRHARGKGNRLAIACGVGILALAALGQGPAYGWADLENDIFEGGAYNPSGIFILDGSYVMNVGELHMNITNWGLIGSRFSSVTNYSDAPSAQWPAGSGNEYLWQASLWVGGVLLGERLVSTGGFDPELLPLDEIEDTIYEAVGTSLQRPAGNNDASGRRLPEPEPDDDDDGLIDEDFGQIGNQMMVCTQYDNTRLSQELLPDHTPMNLQIVQETFQWENDSVDDFVGFQFTVTNIGVTDIDNVYIGFFADCDIGPRGIGGVASDDMAGSFDGLVRASDGSYVPVAVGYMYDNSETVWINGYFGIQFLGHDTDPTGRQAPETVKLRSYNAFSGTQPFDQGGDPSNDDERYELLSEENRDSNTRPGKEDDYRILISAGPFAELAPQRQLQFQVAMVVGPGLNGMLAHCAEAYLTWFGNFYDYVGDVVNFEGDAIGTGENGRETRVCREDFDSGSGDNPFDTFTPDYMDTTCVDQQWLVGQDRLTDADKFFWTDPVTGAQKTCAYVNLDNCFECARQAGEYCTSTGNQIVTVWNCGDPDTPDEEKAGCTGVAGAESQIHWLVGMAPPPPGMRLWPTDNRVHVFWDDLSQNTVDVRTGEIDFESYRIWRADNWDRPFGSSVENGPESNLWQLIAEYDVINEYIYERIGSDGQVIADTLPLGRNTGLDPVSYTPISLDTDRFPQFVDLAESMRVVVSSDSNCSYRERPPVRDQWGNVDPFMLPVVAWESYPAVLDTYWAVTPRDTVGGVCGKRPIEYFEYIDYDSHNGFIYFYSVTASDHAIDFGGQGDIRIVGAGQSGDPGSNFSDTVPGPRAQTAEEREANGTNIYVYPNPATRDALEEFQQLNPNSDDPTGVRVMFTNLPQARNTVEIFTLSGDLVQTLQHDGTQGYGQVGWNLVSRNGQEIVSGIYLYAVQSDDDRFDDFVGKFVVVR